MIFLAKQGAIEKKQPKEPFVYTVTSTGLRILDFFKISKSFETHEYGLKY